MLAPLKGTLTTTRWFIGNLPEAEFHSADTWVKWGVHRAGENSDRSNGPPTNWKPVRGQHVSVLIDGAMTLQMRDPDAGRMEQIDLSDRGDYIFMPDGWDHRWLVTQNETLVMTVRWPRE